MNLRHIVIAGALTVAAAPAFSNTLITASSLGMLLASEKACGYTYDQSAIIKFIEQNVSADDMGFAPMLDVMTVGSAAQLADMSDSSLTAQCASAGQSARHYGFMV